MIHLQYFSSFSLSVSLFALCHRHTNNINALGENINIHNNILTTPQGGSQSELPLLMHHWCMCVFVRSAAYPKLFISLVRSPYT